MDERALGMIAPTVGRFLPGYTGCNWTVDQAGKVLCATRRDLQAHHCTPAPEMQARPVGGGAVNAVADVAPAGPVTHLELHRALLECTGAALVLGMRIEREAHPDAPADLEEKIAEAEKRMEAASEALLRALEKYTTPQLLRHPHASV